MTPDFALLSEEEPEEVLMTTRSHPTTTEDTSLENDEYIAEEPDVALEDFATLKNDPTSPDDGSKNEQEVQKEEKITFPPPGSVISTATIRVDKEDYENTTEAAEVTVALSSSSQVSDETTAFAGIDSGTQLFETLSLGKLCLFHREDLFSYEQSF